MAIAMADAVDKAHRQGVTHGGLNPSIVMLTAERAQAARFRRGKAEDEAILAMPRPMVTTRTSIPSLSAVPTVAAPYMAPEQFAGARGGRPHRHLRVRRHPVRDGHGADRRSRKRHRRCSIAAVQSVDPEPASKAQPMAPPALDHVIRRCLSKDPRQRLQTAWDLMLQLQWIAEGGSQVGVPAPVAARRQKRDWAVWGGAAAASLLAVGLAPSAVSSFRARPEPELVRFTVSNMGAGARASFDIAQRPLDYEQPWRPEPRRGRAAARIRHAAGARRRQRHHAAVLVAGQPLHRVL